MTLSWMKGRTMVHMSAQFNCYRSESILNIDICYHDTSFANVGNFGPTALTASAALSKSDLELIIHCLQILKAILAPPLQGHTL